MPILFISARNSDDDQIIALGIGGDDYISKPYSLGVLLAKVKAVLKRYGQSMRQDGYSDGWLKIDFAAKSVWVQDKPLKLTMMEFRLLAYLAANQGRVVSKKELFEKVWEDRFTASRSSAT